MTTADGAPARAAWARLVGLDALAPLTVVVDARSPLCRPGWIGILALDGTVTVVVPTEDLRAPVRAALQGLAPEDATRPAVVGPRLPPAQAVLGPATLSYPPPGFDPGAAEVASPVAPDELGSFLAAIPAADLDESGFATADMDAVHGGRAANGELASICGYRRWPNGVAHLGILTAAAHRRRGHARLAASAVLRVAMEEGLLPQWRARVPESQALAARLGLVSLGAQLGFERPE